jgi:hypothetical protein
MPQLIPNIVRKLRNLCRHRAVAAWRKISAIIMFLKFFVVFIEG